MHRWLPTPPIYPPSPRRGSKPLPACTSRHLTKLLCSSIFLTRPILAVARCCEACSELRRINLLRPSEKDAGRWLRSEAWKAEVTQPISPMPDGPRWSRTSRRRKNGAGTRGCTALPRSSTPSSTYSRAAASGGCCRGTFHPGRPCYTPSGCGGSTSGAKGVKARIISSGRHFDDLSWGGLVTSVPYPICSQLAKVELHALG